MKKAKIKKHIFSKDYTRITGKVEEEEGEDGHCSLALFSGGGLVGGAGADDFVAGSLSSCFTVSVGGSGSFFTSTAAKEQRRTSRRCKTGLLCDYYYCINTIFSV